MIGINITKFSQLFKKVGGLGLVKNYFKSGVFFTAISQLLIVGFSKKALEILRLSVQLKVQQKLSKKYGYILHEFPYAKNKKLEHKSSKTIWICWLQGIDKAPKLVQKCYKSICKHLSDWDIIVITTENYTSYTNLPTYIIDKWKQGKITNTHFSDILRVDLLVTNGGMWIDSTVLCTSGEVPEYITNSDLFLYQVLKPGLDGHCIKTSSWLINAKSNNIILSATRDLLFEYWKKKNSLVDYFLLHHFISMSMSEFSQEWGIIPKFPNSIPHILLLQLFNKYDENEFKHIKNMTCFHKLNYKREMVDMVKKGTYYDVIINEGSANK